jgi:hypothetical protein
MEHQHPERELGEWLDRLAIQDLINQYSDAVTRADWDQCEAVFAPDAIWEGPPGIRYENRAAFLEILKGTTSNDLLIQTPHSSVVTLTGADLAEANNDHSRAESGVGVSGLRVGLGLLFREACEELPFARQALENMRAA